MIERGETPSLINGSGVRATKTEKIRAFGKREA